MLSQLSQGLALSALLACASSAQLSFDLIVPDQLECRAGTSAQVSNTWVGLIVNTGTVPFHVDEVSDASFFGSSSEELVRFQIEPGNSSSAPTIQPGEAAGVDAALYTDLLEDDETYTGKLFGALGVRLVGSAGLQPDIAYTFQMQDQAVNLTMDVEFVASGDLVHPLSARRWSSQPAVAKVETTVDGCAYPHPQFGALPHRLVPQGVVTGPTTIAELSNLPMIGHFAFHLAVAALFPPEEAGRFWFLTIGPVLEDVEFLGCQLYAIQQPVLSGFLEPGFPDPTGPYLSLPIPNNVSLVGKTAHTQWTLITPNATNGVMSSSEALALTIGG